MSRHGRIGLACIAFALGCEGGEEPSRSESAASPRPPARAAFVGAEACADCHPAEAELWRGSHHDRAMEVAAPDTVLGDFDSAHLEHSGSLTRFLRRGDAFFVETDGPDSARAEFRVTHTFGVYPLQQYLVELPGGRRQPLGTAWDARPEALGGQRWFHLYPGERLAPGDPLHWSSRAQSWNRMCADCHSTALRKGYDLASDAYDTRWSEMDVACEACHGPGSLHTTSARAGDAPPTGLPVDFAAGGARAWRFAGDAPIAVREGPAPRGLELDTCAPCHSRRAPLREPAAPGGRFLDSYRPALLDAGLYFADGQIQDEVYVWGSFVQSRMHAAGVTCSDCHDPHSLAVATPPEATCSRCHQPEAFATPEHHHHPEASEGSSCLGCHMPARVYMGVDARRDHGFRVPRPALAQRIGAPDACTTCHGDRDAAWASEVARGWWGEAGAIGRTHFGEVLHAGRERAPGSGPALAALAGDSRQPAIARATALRLLEGAPARLAAPAIERALRDPEALLRMAAAETAEAQEPRARLALLRPLLIDPVRAVRVEAARALADGAADGLRPEDRGAYEAALAEYRAAQRLASDTPEAHVNLGLLAARHGALGSAREAYETALRLGPWFVPAYVNLADLEREQGDDAAAEATLRRGLASVGESAALEHALGLALVRLGRAEEARAALARAAELAPREPRYAYVHAVALHSAGETRAALRVLDAAHLRQPGDPELLHGLATFSSEVGERDAALRYARALLELVPGHPAAQRLVHQLEAASREE